jgi:pyruvate/2-oxoglutarate dehydrogenase complex dihydrolipoamide dehydrogenase (E3) component
VATDDKGFIRVDDRLQTTAPGIWAAGDVNGQQPFTRVCQEEGKVVYANAFEGQSLEIDRTALPHAIFTDPEIGSVGLTEEAARGDGYDLAAGLVTFDRVEKAEIIGETAGFIKYVADRRTHRLLGCHVIGPAAADLVYDAVIVMRRRGTLDELASPSASFPRSRKAWRAPRAACSARSPRRRWRGH